MTTAKDGPLTGLRVVDLTSVLLGPYAAQILGDMGADVIKVEGPEGDTTRDLGPRRSPGMAAIYLNANRNKRALCMDLKSAEGHAAFLKLVKTADIFLHNMRPSAIKRLALTYEDLRKVNPNLIYCGAYGFDQDGPYADKPAYDDMIQGVSGLAASQSQLMGRPGYMPTVIADKATALTSVYAITMALYHRERTGEGQEVKIPMFETMVQFHMLEHLYGGNFEPPIGPVGYPRALSPNRHPYKTKDGMIGVLPYVDKQWRAFFEMAGRPELMDDPRFCNIAARLDNIDAAYQVLGDIIETRTSAEWLRDLDAASIPAVPINTPQDLLEDEHLKATGFWQTMEHPSEGTLNYPGIPTEFSASPGRVRRHAPQLGEHNREILLEIGMTDNEIDKMISDGILVSQNK
ncbi:CoA transferase [uncultured Sneathiella sp.]|uniref:CaiB/BaiF CoA transferase family protein n=1 Tax=uncultured Sneathiella sp. TaxID=879315 RepID=UPI0030D77E55|tara:strand:- start:499 stop:1710 length:1212 start_codon:yes stop_codon:yes gene_type:complete